MSHPMDDIEQRTANHDMGKMIAQIFHGAYEETNDTMRVLWATVAYFIAMMKHGNSEDIEQ